METELSEPGQTDHQAVDSRSVQTSECETDSQPECPTTSTGVQCPRQLTPKNYSCRICYLRNLQEPNLSLCDCRGTLGLVHRSCLELWLAASRSSQCELCGHGFTIRKKLKYGIFKGVVVWLTVKKSREERLAMAWDCFKLSTALAVFFLINYQTLAVLGTFQMEDTSLWDLVDPFFQSEIHWGDIAAACNKLMNIVFLVMGTPITLGAICRQLQKIDIYYNNWYSWYQRQSVVELVEVEERERHFE